MALVFARAARVRGALRGHGALLLGTLEAAGSAPAAFERDSGELLWERPGLPPLAAADAAGVYAYARAGTVAALGFDGAPRWSAAVADERGEGARRRGLAAGPFAADVVPNAGGIAVAARGELLQLAAGDGAVVARAAVARPGGDDTARTAVARLAAAGADTLVGVGAWRTSHDDAGAPPAALWEPPSALESLRTEPADLVAFDLELRERWRLAPPADAVWAARAPASADGAVVAVASALAAGGGAVSLFDAWLVCADARTGAVRWSVAAGPGAYDPVVCGDAVLAGTPPALYELADGARRWQLPEPRMPDPAVRPVVHDGGLVTVRDGRLIAIDPADGATRPLGEFAHSPLAGAVTTELLVAGGVAYLGVEEAGRRELRALLL